MSEIRSQATPARDELAEAVGLEVFEAVVSISGGFLPRSGDDHAIIRKATEKIMSAIALRTVNSVAELDALPVNSVVVDASDTPRTKRYGDSHMGAGWTNAGRSPLSSRELADGRPMRVFFTPGDAG